MEERQSIGRLVSILYRHAKVYFHREMGNHDLGHGQLPLLMYIIMHEQVTQHQINDHFYLDKGSTSSMIKNLEKNGFITRRQDPGDKRSSVLEITEKTTQLIPEIKQVFKGWTETLLHGFSADEQEKAFELLNRMIENSVSYLEERKNL